MADQEVVEKTAHRLSEAEVDVLRDQAAEMVLNYAAERMPCFGRERDERTNLEVFDDQTERMMGAAEVFAPLKAAGLAFSTAKGLPAPSERVVVAFTDRAMSWLRHEREDTRKMLAEQRGSIEVAEYEDGSGTPRHTFLLWVLDGIFQGVDD
jgi:hypothetical protein